MKMGNEDGTAASIREKLNNRNVLRFIKYAMTHGQWGSAQQQDQQSSSNQKQPQFFFNNVDSWIGLKEFHKDRLQKVQDDSMTEMFQVSAKGTQKCMLWLDRQMLKMRWRIIQIRLETMGKPDTNLCKQALKEGQNTCNGEDLLTKCKDL